MDKSGATTLNEKFNDYLRYTKIKTGISGLDKLLYDGLVIPYSPVEKEDNMLIVIRGNDNIDKTVLSLQLLQAIGSSFKKQLNRDVTVQYYSDYLRENYIYELQLDVLISSVVKNMIERDASGNSFEGNNITNFFFDTKTFVRKGLEVDVCDKIPYGLIKENADELICKEALYYNARTNSLHYRMSQSNDNSSSDMVNVVFNRKHNKLNDYLNDNAIAENEIEAKFDFKFVPLDVITSDLNNIDLKEPDKTESKKEKSEIKIVCCNLSSEYGVEEDIREENKDNNRIKNESRAKIIDEIRKAAKIGIVVVDDKTEFQTEKSDLIFELSEGNYENYEYLIKKIEITKSLFQMTALGWHQYKRRDYGIEVYPSLPVYCMQRRYLQRALVYTHSNVLLDTYQQYLDNTKGTKTYKDYLHEYDSISEGYFKALHPTTNKKVSVHQVLDRVFINPAEGYYLNDNTQKNNSTDFLYGTDAGITAIIGEANTYKRFLTYGSAFSSANKREHTLFLLLNKDDKIARRRLLCPARRNKCKQTDCRTCYNYLHFMNILMGCITPEQILFYLIRQIKCKYPDGEIRRIIVDDLQVIDYCFPLLKQDTLFLPALIDECRNRGIALYFLCDKHAKLVQSLRSLADNVICTERTPNGGMKIYVERYAGYNTRHSKIFAGQISQMEDLFECYEKGSHENKRTFFNLDSDKIKEEKMYCMDNFWNVNCI